MQTTPSITLWGVKVSPYVRKVIVTLEEKKLPYTLIETFPAAFLKIVNQPIPADLMKVSPLGRVPALQDGDASIADSAVIGVYLDKKYPNTPSLYPNDPEQHAKTLWFENFADHILSKITYDKVLFPVLAKPLLYKTECDHEEVKRVIQEELPPLLTFLEKALSSNNQWIVGDAFTVADIAIATQFSGMDASGYPIDNVKWPKLSHYLKRVGARESYQTALKAA
ncbi:MAG TPA: glutathione S-transferase family protein [Gammaproteobacteria bacterium]|nr:glutathione S-transferase family protein [Gammaproteobacteria bacterium]